MQRLKSIYVVEDNAASRTMMLDFLGQYGGVALKGFMTGEACLGDMIHTKTTPDLVLMDYHLDASMVTKYHGLDTLAEIKKISPATRIIMFTSFDEEKTMKLAKELGASDYVIKGPGGFDEIKHLIEGGFDVG